MPHQRFRYARVNAVHRHMVAVVGRPPKRKLGQVSSSYHNTAGLVGNIHDYLRPLPRLTVFKGNVCNAFVLSDVGKMLSYRGGYVYFLQGGSVRVRKTESIVFCTVCCAEARHCDGQYPLAVKSQHIESVYRNNKCKGAVKSSRKTYNCVFAADMPQTCCKSGCLHDKYFLAAAVKVVFISRHKRHWREAAF